MRLQRMPPTACQVLEMMVPTAAVIRSRSRRSKCTKNQVRAERTAGAPSGGGATRATHSLIDHFSEQLTVVLSELIKPELKEELERERAIETTGAGEAEKCPDAAELAADELGALVARRGRTRQWWRRSSLQQAAWKSPGADDQQIGAACKRRGDGAHEAPLVQMQKELETQQHTVLHDQGHAQEGDQAARGTRAEPLGAVCPGDAGSQQQWGGCRRCS